MKIGLLTLQNMYNPGVGVRTFAQKKVIEDYGIKAAVIHYHPFEKEIEIKEKPGFLRSLFGKNKDNAVSGISEDMKYFVRKNLDIQGDFSTFELFKSASLTVDGYLAGCGQPIFDLVDVSSENAIKDLQEDAARKASDPIFWLQKKEYNLIKRKAQIKEKYLCTYIEDLTNEKISYINKMASQMDLVVASNLPSGSFEREVAGYQIKDSGDLIGCMDQAQAVITDSYEGTALALLMEKDFVSVDAGELVRLLLKRFQMSTHAVKSDASPDKKLAVLKSLPKVRKHLTEVRTDALYAIEEAFQLTDNNVIVDCPTQLRKDECYGCFACKEVCPTNAITMQKDQKGFYYPVVNHDTCIDCKACVKACIRKSPQHVTYDENYPKVYAMLNKQEELRLGKSSSGAVFPELARYVIEQNGYVIGVKWDENMNPVSAVADTMEEAKKFSGSKYVKSEFNGMFPKVKELLKEGKPVLYTGVPCECAGLRSYLKKDYENLYICEIVCHAAPSPKVFSAYIDYLNKKFKTKVTNIQFRNKTVGWLGTESTMVITFENGKVIKANYRKNNYVRAFANDYITRANCTKCDYTYRKRVGDFTIGDFWGIREVFPDMFDDKGCSLFMVNTQKALGVFEKIKEHFEWRETNIEDGFKKNHVKPTRYRVQRVDFFNRFGKEPIDDLLGSFNDLR